MSINRQCLTTLTVLFLVCAVPAAAQDDEGPSFSVGGLFFADLYGVPSHHLPEGDGAAGLVVRRGYLTFDGDTNKMFFGRLRFELNQAGEFETYTYDVDFKDLYVGVRVRRQTVVVGLSPTPTFDLIESIWGMRYLARTPLDLQGIASRDTGVAVRGPLNGSGSFSYRAMVGSGAGFGAESGDGEKYMGAFTWRPSGDWVLDVYADYDFLTGEADRATLQAFVGYTSDPLRWGAHYSYQDRQEDAPLDLASMFVVWRLQDDASLVLRLDRLFQPSPRGDDISYLPFDSSAPATFIIAGAEFRVREWLSLTPNVVITAYDRNDAGRRPPTDVYLRLTFFLDFE